MSAGCCIRSTITTRFRNICNALPDAMDEEGFVHLSQKPGLGDDINFDYIDANLEKAAD